MQTLILVALVMLMGCQSQQPQPADPWVITETHHAKTVSLAEQQVELLQGIQKAVEQLPKATEPTPLTPEQFDAIEDRKVAERPRCDCPDCTCENCTCQPGDCHCPKKLAEKPQPKTYSWGPDHFRLTVYSESWCGPCQRQKKIEHPKLHPGVKVRYLPSNQMPKFPENRKSQIPFSNLEYWDGQAYKPVKRWLGFTTANQVNAAVDSKVDQLSGRGKVPTIYADAAPASNLQQWVRQRYKPGQQLMADVSPRSSVWMHLVQHGFSSAEVRGLSMWDALCLHDAAHRGLIGKQHP